MQNTFSAGILIRNLKVLALLDECRTQCAYHSLVEIERIHGDEENLLKFVKFGSLEAVISCLSLHWVNDLPGMTSRNFANSRSTV
jgi:hypothetical protein